MSARVIETAGLTRYFGHQAAVHEVSFSVAPGSVFAMLGRNGTGKTTLIRMLLGLLAPTRGQATILGHSSHQLPPAVRGRIGYLAEGHPVVGWMRAKEFESFQSQGQRRWSHKLFDHILDHFEVSPKTRAKHLSRGQRTGLALAATLAAQPELLVLDDPALGLDRVAQRALLEAMVFVTQQEGCTIFFTSHALHDVERVADHLAIIEAGRLRVCCPTDYFLERVQEFTLAFEHSPEALPEVPGLVEATRTDTTWRLVVAHPGEAAQQAIGALQPTQVTQASLSLEDAVTAYLAQRRGTRLLDLEGAA